MIIHLSIILGSLFVDSVSRFSETCAEHQVDEGEEEQEELGNELKDGGSYQKECSAEKEDKSEHIGALLDQDHWHVISIFISVANVVATAYLSSFAKPNVDGVDPPDPSQEEHQIVEQIGHLALELFTTEHVEQLSHRGENDTRAYEEASDGDKPEFEADIDRVSALWSNSVRILQWCMIEHVYLIVFDARVTLMATVRESECISEGVPPEQSEDHKLHGIDHE